jgi:hypothetical protein
VSREGGRDEDERYRQRGRAGGTLIGPAGPRRWCRARYFQVA